MSNVETLDQRGVFGWVRAMNRRRVPLRVRTAVTIDLSSAISVSIWAASAPPSRAQIRWHTSLLDLSLSGRREQ
jgi:hypothetical protein